ncbi:CCA tRNA nucleotidyltransferase [Chroococcidiopsis thermalis]|uniref:Polynucleotide adenylyltransferase region n=1 Tax=Chroococcidiopsis thermalis (strain PCC 7203) TaxID=251229 RepID=K9U1X7_CHRTP|nr:CCA tRNA nucleotidyltransferase [Chroococcidiopsis thermalis]AFY88815.1 Polynucleotide adenylyltransferase region [Chroococcidiopsis thermalis PCC 7203]PSB46352.1 CCA tRNA nucleotidyltransferase [Cyanosarcina cf. burmensis CCALA 770]
MSPPLLSQLFTNLPFEWEWLPQPSYLVGGAVRDRLLGRNSDYLDLDFVLPEKAVETARAIAKHYKAGFVLLDAQRQIARVVFKNATVDFALQEGATLETDLQRRDFTINAIAYNPHTQELIDPLQGYTDLQQRLLRMISPANLQDDPLRLLRGYRQAAQLDFALEPNTRSIIRQLAPLIGRVAAERVRVELGYLLNSDRGTAWLEVAGEDGLLTPWFPSMTRSHIERLLKVNSAAASLSSFPQLVRELSQPVRNTIKTSWLGIVKLTCLVSTNSATAEIELDKLAYSRSEIKAVTTALQLLPQLQAKSPEQMTLAEQYFFFRAAGVVFPAIVILAVVQGTSIDLLSLLIHRYLNPKDPVAHPTPILTGNDLMKALQLSPSPLIGEMLLQIQLAQIEGKISTVEEAIAFAAKRLDS